MPVAVLSDIHANLVALEAVLAECRDAKVEHYVLLGDYVGYYYQPREVVALLRSLPTTAILGNHDRMALAARRDPVERAKYETRYGHGIEVALASLDADDWAWLEALPAQRQATFGTRCIHLAHGAPFDDDAYVYPNSDVERVAAARGVDADAVWLGHTHWPMMGGGRPAVLNPGSVGQPRDIGGLAAWALYYPDSDVVAMRRTEFPTAPLIAEAQRRDPEHPRNHQVLARRRTA